jgi:hypothetical protein
MLKKIVLYVIVISLSIFLGAFIFDKAVNIANHFLSKQYVANAAMGNMDFLNYVGVVSVYLCLTYFVYLSINALLAKLNKKGNVKEINIVLLFLVIWVSFQYTAFGIDFSSPYTYIEVSSMILPLLLKKWLGKIADYIVGNKRENYFL